MMLDAAKVFLKIAMTLIVYGTAAIYLPGIWEPIYVGCQLIAMAIILFLLAMIVTGIKSHFSGSPTTK